MGKSRPIVAKGKAKAAADFEKIINEGEGARFLRLFIKE